VAKKSAALGDLAAEEVEAVGEPVVDRALDEVEVDAALAPDVAVGSSAAARPSA
jgi:hypothetical protein